MPSDVELVNAALRRVGARRITNLSDDIPNAGVASDIYSIELDNLLRLHAWNFAATRASLARLSATPAFEWQFAYSLPADWIRTVSVSDNDAGTGCLDYKMEAVDAGGGTFVSAILTNAETVFLRYVRRVTDTTLMTADFRQCLILALARVFAISPASSNSLAQGLAEDFKRALWSARSTDGIEDAPERLPEGDWATSRMRGGTYSWFAH